MGIVEFLATFTSKPNQHPTERSQTIKLGNELLKQVGIAAGLPHLPRCLNFLQSAETEFITSIDTVERFEGCLMLGELDTLARSAPDKDV
jgi:hypothetical protein